MGIISYDTSMRELLDGVDSNDLSPLFKDAFRQLQRGKSLERFVFMEAATFSISTVPVSIPAWRASKDIKCSISDQKQRCDQVQYWHVILRLVKRENSTKVAWLTDFQVNQVISGAVLVFMLSMFAFFVTTVSLILYQRIRKI